MFKTDIFLNFSHSMKQPINLGERAIAYRRYRDERFVNILFINMSLGKLYSVARVSQKLRSTFLAICHAWKIGMQ